MEIHGTHFPLIELVWKYSMEIHGLPSPLVGLVVQLVEVEALS